MGELLILSDVVKDLDSKNEYTLFGVCNWQKIDREYFHLICHRLPGKPKIIPSLRKYVRVHILKEADDIEERIRDAYWKNQECAIFGVQNCEIVSNNKEGIGLRFYNVNVLDGRIRVFERDKYVVCEPSELGAGNNFYVALHGIRAAINDAHELKQVAKLRNRA